jgi:hypothetical protein
MTLRDKQQSNFTLTRKSIKAKDKKSDIMIKYYHQKGENRKIDESVLPL